jgi:hypothetical protein
MSTQNRTTSASVPALLAAALLAACSQTRPAVPALAAPSEAQLVFAKAQPGETRLFAQGESGTGPAVALTPAGARAEFGGSAGRTVVYGLLAQDGTLASVHSVSIDGTGSAKLADLPAAQYRGLRGLHAASEGTLLVELAVSSGARELHAVRGGALVKLAAGSFLAERSGEVVYLAQAKSLADFTGDVRAIRVDGSAERALGGNDGDDQFHGVIAGAALLTAHRSGAAEVRSVTVASAGAAAKVRAGSAGVLFSGGVLVARHGAAVETLDGALNASAIALPSGAEAVAVLADGRVAGFVAGQGLYAANASASTLLDGTKASALLAPHVVRSASGDRLVFTVSTDAGSFLRSAKLDGTASVQLAEGHGQQLLFTSETAGGRVVFYRTKGNEPGGWLSSVRVDGGDEKILGDSATGTLAAADHDFGGVTRSGRIVFEAELIEHLPPQLFVVEPDGSVRGLTGASSYSTLSAIVE